MRKGQFTRSPKAQARLDRLFKRLAALEDKADYVRQQISATLKLP